MCHHASCSHHCGEFNRRDLFMAAGGTMVGGFLLRAATAAECAMLGQGDAPSNWPDVSATPRPWTTR